MPSTVVVRNHPVVSFLKESFSGIIPCKLGMHFLPSMFGFVCCSPEAMPFANVNHHSWNTFLEHSDHFSFIPFSCDSVYPAGTELMLHDLLSMLPTFELIVYFRKQESNLIDGKKQMHPSSISASPPDTVDLGSQECFLNHLLLLMLLDEQV